MASVEAAGIEVVAPIQKGFSSVSQVVSGIVGSLWRIGSLDRENQRLLSEVERLNSRIAALQQAEEENQRLRALLDYKAEGPETEYMVAGVVGRGQNNITRSIILNKGTKDSVKKDSVVVTPGGLVGRVTKVFPDASKVLLITDPSSAVNAVVSRSNVEGVVTGRLNSGLFMEFVKADADVQVGDVVMTSGLGGRFPRGIVIGQVSDIVSKDLYLFKEVYMRPATDVESQEEVMIVMGFTPIEVLEENKSERPKR